MAFLERLSQTAVLSARLLIMSSKKRKVKSLGSSSKSFKQQKEDSNIDLLNRYFLEVEFKAKFAKAFRFVHGPCISLIPFQ